MTPGIMTQDAATLLARANGRLQFMATKRRLSRAGIQEALVFAERAVKTMQMLLEEDRHAKK